MPDVEATITLVSERSATSIFPPVMPADLGNENEKWSATGILEHICVIEESDKRNLIEYIESQYVKSIVGISKDGDDNDEWARSRFALQEFYPLTIRFCISKALSSREFEHRTAAGTFVPLLPVTSLSEAEKREAAQ